MDRRAFLIAAIGAAVAVAGWWALGLGVEALSGPGGGAWFDTSVIEYFRDHRSGVLVDVLRVLTEMGGTVFVASILILVAVALARRSPASSAAAFPLLTLVGALTLSRIAKALVARPRPTEPLTFVGGSAFPSGHATAAAALFAALAVLALSQDRSRQRWWIVATCAALALLVAFSRVYLGAHWPTDVIAGLGLGLFWTAIAALATRPLEKASDTPPNLVDEPFQG